ncbi:MAG TPA: hypothetical protein VGX23_38160 [Actinocrinis sp.]|nr:hypothetical protein [Actinocrinis sp.]
MDDQPGVIAAVEGFVFQPFDGTGHRWADACLRRPKKTFLDATCLDETFMDVSKLS